MVIPKVPQFTYNPDKTLQVTLRKYVKEGCRQTGFRPRHFKTLLLIKALEQDIMNVNEGRNKSASDTLTSLDQETNMEKEKTAKKLLNVLIDEDLMYKFKAVCTFERKTMTEVINNHIENFINENKDKLKSK